MSGPEQSRVKRRWRNYLLDADLQLKYASWVAAFIVLVGGVAGIALWRSQRSLIEEAESAVAARSRAAEVSRELSNAVLSKELLARFNDPAFVAQFEGEAKEIEKRYEAEQKEVLAQRAKLVTRQQIALWTLVGALVGLFLFAVMGTIVLTHRMVGPLFRIRRIVGEITEGKLETPAYGLRQGDELQELFEEFTRMVKSLKAREVENLERTTRVIAALERAGASPEATSELRAMQEEFRSRAA